MRAAAAARGAPHRADARFRHLRFVRPDLGGQTGAARARHRRQAGAAANGAVAESARPRTAWKDPTRFAARWNLRDEQIASIYERYLRALTDSNALDFDDLLLKTVELFETSAETRERYARKFRYVMVDEYQDTNRPQYMLIKRLAEIHRNLAVVGDPDQSIYKWRGADLRNILDFEHDFPEARVVRLEQNYRSTQVILDAATAVIQQNRNRKDKRLWTDRKGGRKIVYFRGGDELEEADFITRSDQAGTSRGRRQRCRGALSHQRAVAGD